MKKHFTTLEATYRIVTPMFCAGADQNTAELRLPSFLTVPHNFASARSADFQRTGEANRKKCEDPFD